ncbi:GSCOCT00005600001.3-RA-CDS [Cotesia congregata]|uniref:Chemosensory protein 33.5600 n=1 Tax=Cotesia congregata TaxID=51543 RepID=A0A8J2HFI0_COTCN|nr:GSCOCT00005600001.3-RA-CDS [Cotesia congregata]CAG5099635.1 Chemosensory protein 33.5600 [Cotesia congregata]
MSRLITCNFKMKLLVIIFFLSSAFSSENISLEKLPKNISVLLKNERLFDQYINCIFDRGPCTSYGERIKEVLPDFFKTDCSNCSEKEKNLIKQTLNFIKENKPNIYKEINEKFKPPRRPKSLFEAIFGF